MFLLRLKTEFSENLKIIIALWLTLAVIAWSFFDWWNGDLTSIEGAMSVIGLLVAGLLVIMLVGTMFKRDDLKDPHEFWTTRPIRAWTLFGTKLFIAFLTIVLPFGVLMTVIGLMAGVGITAVWNGLELMLWVSFATFLLGLSAMAYPGGNRALLGAFCFFGGVILTCIVLSNRPIDRLLLSHRVDDLQIQWNLMMALLFLTAWFIWQCLRQIRDKHLRQRPSALVAIGILTVLIIAFVPIPGGFTGSATHASTTTLPKVTKAKTHFKDSDYGGMDFGTKYDAKFVSMNIELLPDQKLVGDAFHFSDFDLTVTGQDDAPQRAEISYMTVVSPGDSEHTIEARPIIAYHIFDREPGSSNSSSSGSNSDSMALIKSLPLKKVRIQGTIMIRQINYRTIHRGSLAQPFEINDNNLKIAFTNTPNRMTNHQSSVTWKTYSPALLTARSSRRFDPVRFRVEHAEAPNYDWYNQLDSGSSGGGGFFGSYRDTELRISDRELESDYHWNNIREKGYNKSVKEWKQEAQLICEVQDQIRPYVLPVDIEVEVPDPVMVRELMLKGEL